MEKNESPYKDTSPQWFFNPSNKVRTILIIIVAITLTPWALIPVWIFSNWSTTTKIIASLLIIGLVIIKFVFFGIL